MNIYQHDVIDCSFCTHSHEFIMEINKIKPNLNYWPQNKGIVNDNAVCTSETLLSSKVINIVYVYLKHDNYSLYCKFGKTVDEHISIVWM